MSFLVFTVRVKDVGVGDLVVGDDDTSTDSMSSDSELDGHAKTPRSKKSGMLYT